MMRRFLSLLVSAFFVSPFVLAQDSEASASGSETVLAPQSEIVTVLNEKNENGQYIAGRDENGFPTMTFRMTVPEDANGFMYFAEYYGDKNAFFNRYNFWYHQPKYNKALLDNLRRTGVRIDGVDYDWTFSASCKSDTVDGATVRDLTLSLKDYKNKNYTALKGRDFEISFDTLAVVCRAGGVGFFYGNKKYLPETYSFVSDGEKIVEQVSATVKSSELDNITGTTSLYLNAGSMLIVDGELTCKNIYVEAADEATMGLPAGIVVNSGATLLADSVYFMSNFEDERSVGYIINNGVCSAGFVFMKNGQNTRKLDVAYAERYNYMGENSAGQTIPMNNWYMSFPSFASPVKTRSGWVDMTYRILNGNSKVYTTGLWSPFAGSVLWNDLASIMHWEDFFAADLSVPFFLMHIYSDSEILRTEGEINDDDSYSLPVKNVSSNGQLPQTFVNNPYPAPVDWRSVADDAAEADGDDSFVDALRDIQYGFYKHSMYSIYNLKTGITTLDVPNKMYYGYLQPNMTNVSLLHQTGVRSEVKFTKANLSSYQQADAKYAGSDYTYGLPYVRLYVDETVDSLAKGVGRRSVVALYFVPQSLYDELHSEASEDYDSVYDINTVWESLADNRLKKGYALNNFGAGQIFPYVGAYGVNRTDIDIPVAIKMVAIPESEGSESLAEQYIEAESVLKNYIRIAIESHSNETNLEGAVEFGVVDYDLKDSGVGIRVGGLSLNYPGEDDVLKTVITVKDGYADNTQKGFASRRKYCDWDCRQLSLDLTVAKGLDRPTSEKATPDGSALITSARGSLTVSASHDGVLRVFDILGRVVVDRPVSAGDNTVSVPAGAYVVSFSSGESSTVKSVVVK